MKKIFISFLLLLAITTAASAQTKAEAPFVQTPLGSLPTQIYQEDNSPSGSLHVQGVAVDVKRGFAYFSFTTQLVKTDLKGNIIGSVTGLTCHLGCIELDPETGDVLGSMEYKDDVIGKGILHALKTNGENQGNAFYVGIFYTKNITRPNMDASSSNVLKATYLSDVLKMYSTKVVNNGKSLEHKYGCSGIDGISVGPQFGKKDGKNYLNVALGIYGDLQRTDNDYQVLLQYDIETLRKMAHPLEVGHFHHIGPKKALNTYFVFTGNSTWGVQNLEYDPYTNYWFAAVYVGKKPQYPNYPLFTINGTRKAVVQTLKGFNPVQKGLVLSLANVGLKDPSTGIRGWNFKWGSTGIASLGKGFFYISHNGRNEKKCQNCTLILYKWTGNTEQPFEEVK